MNSRHTALVLLTAALLAPGSRAQLADGAMLAACYRVTTTQPCPISGSGGIYQFDPRSGAVQPLTNLPPEVLGNVPASTFIHGADFAVRIPHTNLLVTNAWGDSTIGQEMPVYVLGLDGLDVTTTTRHDIGVLGNGAWGGAGLPQAEVMPDGRVLLAVDPTTFQTGEALASEFLAVLDPHAPPGPGALTTIPVTPLPPGSPNAMALDVERGVVWLGVFQQTQSTIYRVDFPQGGAPVPILNMPSELVTGLALQHDGTLLATSYAVSNGAAQLLRIDPSGPSTAVFPQLTGLFYAETVCIEPATGDLFVVAGSTCAGRDVHRISPADPATGVRTTVTTSAVGGWSVASGLDVDPNPEVFGSSSGPSPLEVTWQVAPNATGLPRIGNLGFALELVAPVAPLLVGVLLGVSTNSPPAVPGLDLLVDPITSRLLVPGPSMTMPLAIPSQAGLVGLGVFAQGIFFDASLRLGATAGVQLTVLP